MVAYSGTCGTNLTWNLETTNGSLTISGSGDMNNYTSDDHPPWYDHRANITSIVISNSVTSIGNFAFYQLLNVTSVQFGTAIRSIGNYAFTGTKLTNVTIPKNIATIGDCAFYAINTITSVTIADSVTSIGAHAFYSCSSLNEVNIGAGVTSIGSGAFLLCKKLTILRFYGKQPTLGEDSFKLGSYGESIRVTVYTKGGWGSDTVFTSTVKGDYTTFTYKKMNPEVKVKVNGAWKSAVPRVKVSGAWKEVSTIYIKVSGSWKKVK